MTSVRHQVHVALRDTVDILKTLTPRERGLVLDVILRMTNMEFRTEDQIKRNVVIKGMYTPTHQKTL